MELRLADATTDAAAVAAIYAPHVAAGHASFETAPPSADEMGERIAATLQRTPWLVAVEAGEVIGYAYAGPHQARAGYRWSLNVSTYVAERWHRHGVATSLYRALFSILRAQGFVNVYAGVALPNGGSLQLHRSIGMVEVGTYHGVGFKDGVWRDVTWLELALRERPGTPDEPITLPDLLATDAGGAAIAAALRQMT
jgi:phosphinothricin acetyltransferase